MSETFMHIGKFAVRPEARETFVALMQSYEDTAEQRGLTHSNVIEDERNKGTFMHVTVWEKRADWVAVEETDAHRKMHEARNAMLVAPMEHDFICGKVEVSGSP